MKTRFRIPLVKKWLQALLVILVLLPGIIYAAYSLAYKDKIYPGVRVAGTTVGNKSVGEAIAILGNLVNSVGVGVVTVEGAGQKFELNLSELDFKYKVKESAVRAWQVGRQGGIGDRLNQQWQAWWRGSDQPLSYQIEEAMIAGFVATVAGTLDRPAVPPRLKLVEKGVEIIPGEKGGIVEQMVLTEKILSQLGELAFEPITIPIKEDSVEVSLEQLETARMRAEKLVDKTLRLEADEQRWEMTKQELVNFIGFDQDFNQEKIASETATLAEMIDRPTQNAAFRFENGRVVEFKPGKDGLRLSQEGAIRQIELALIQLEQDEEKQITVKLAVGRTEPAVKTSQVNSWGIKELLGRGVSTYKGSIAARVHNVGLSAQRISGVLVAPGETFSFNENVGEIAEATGYQQAYIIRSGRTVLDDGGGVCQTSSTLFRAVMEAGLPIVERRAHSYRVGYYEQNAKAGLDATVFAPTTDFKFLNDTPAHILVQTAVETANRKLTVEIYGTSDGRRGEIVNHQIWDVTPPPPDLYQDDPTLAAGTVKQVDFKAWGAKVKFDYRVKRGGETIYEKTFYQAYQPWQAVFLRGVGN